MSWDSHEGRQRLQVFKDDSLIFTSYPDPEDLAKIVGNRSDEAAFPNRKIHSSDFLLKFKHCIMPEENESSTKRLKKAPDSDEET